jgi:hypothetical protein
MASFAPLASLALVADGDLICWNCRTALIPGFLDLLVACGPVPYFEDMTMPCTACSSLNRALTLCQAAA